MKSKLYMVVTIGLFLCAKFKSFSQANTSLSNLAAATAINHSLTAGTANSLSLGSSTKAWKNIYLSNGVYINNALLFFTPHQSSIAIGNKALYLSSSAGSLIAIGDSAFYHNTTGARGTAVGSYSLFKNTTGDNNTTLGYQSLYNTTTGSSNVAAGMQALYSNTAGNNNIASGAKALYANTTGYSNIAFGIKALYSNTTGSSMIAIGDSALYYSNELYPNIAIGSKALYTNTFGDDNTALGYQALYNNTTGSDNTAIGQAALYNNTIGDLNVAIGNYALTSNTTGGYNLADGNYALTDNSTGYYNTATGVQALYSNTTGSENTAIGYSANVTGSDFTNATALGYSATATASNEVVLGNSSVTAVEAYAPYYNVSDSRVKKNIKENVPGLAFINALRPVTYNYDVHAINDKTGLTAMQNKTANTTSVKASPSSKTSTTGSVTSSTDKATEDAISTKEKKIYTGFVAQEVETAAKKVNYEFSGIHQPQNDKDLYALSYSDFVVPLVKAVQELSRMNDSKQQQIDSLNQRLTRIEAALTMQSRNDNNPVADASSKTISLSSASLLQNTPNPFSNLTTISYNLPEGYTKASIVITDKNGKTLKAVSLNGSDAGSIKVETSTLSAGAYQYSLIVDGKLVVTKQMLLSR